MFDSRLLAVGFLLVAGAVSGQDDPATPRRPAPPPASPAPTPVRASTPGRNIVVQVTEYRLAHAIDPAKSSDEVLQSFDQWKEQGLVELAESIRLSVREEQESMVQIGKSVPVTVATTQGFGGPGGPGGRSRAVQERQFGTILSVLVRSDGDQTALKLEYEATRSEGQGEDDGPPPTYTLVIKTTLRLQPGVKAVVASAGGERSSVLVVLVEAPREQGAPR